MSLLPDVHVNVGQVTFERIYQIFLPLFPGLTLVGGLILANPQSAYAAAATLGLGRYTRVAVFLCAAYVAGLLLYGFSIAAAAICTIVLTRFVAKSGVTRQNEVPSKAMIFRRVATGFLGTLAPAGTGNDVEWHDFYNVLQDYVLRGAPVVSNELWLFFGYLQAAAWALMYLYWRTAIRGHWSVLVVSITLILFAATFPFGANFLYWKYDRLSAWDFIARLINEIKTREKSSSAPSQQVRPNLRGTERQAGCSLPFFSAILLR